MILTENTASHSNREHNESNKATKFKTKNKHLIM